MSAQNETKDPLSAYEQRRQKWIGVFAKTPRETLEACAEKLLVTHQFHTLRAPERGLVMVRARAGDLPPLTGPV